MYQIANSYDSNKKNELKHRDSHIDTAMRIAAKSKLVVDWYNFSSNGSAITVPL